MGLLFGACAVKQILPETSLREAQRVFAMYGLRRVHSCSRSDRQFACATLADSTAGQHEIVQDPSRDVTVAFCGDLFPREAALADLRGGGVGDPDCSGSARFLLASYLVRGKGFLHDLDGVFAAAIFDGRARRLLLFNDPFGCHPLLWAERGGVLLFSTDVQPLLRAWDAAAEVDGNAVAEYLTLGTTLGDKTLVRGITNLEAGGWLEVRDGMVSRGCYDRLNVPLDSRLTPAAAAEELASRFRRAVQKRVQNPDRLELRLTGGYDSRLILSSLTPAQRGSINAVTWLQRDLARTEDRDVLLATQLAGRAGIRHKVQPEKLHTRPFDPFHFFYSRQIPAPAARRQLSGHFGGELYGCPFTDVMAKRLFVEPRAETVRRAMQSYFVDSFRRDLALPLTTLQELVSATAAANRVGMCVIHAWTRAFFSTAHGGTRGGRWYSPQRIFLDGPALPFVDTDCLKLLLAIPAEHRRSARLYNLLYERWFTEFSDIPSNSRLADPQRLGPGALAFCANGVEPKSVMGVSYSSAAAELAEASALFEGILNRTYFRNHLAAGATDPQSAAIVAAFVDLAAWWCFFVEPRAPLVDWVASAVGRMPGLPGRARRRFFLEVVPRVDRTLRRLSRAT